MDPIAEPWGERTPYDRGTEWPPRPDCVLAAGVAPGDVDRWVPTASLLHSNGDGIDIAVREGVMVGVRGRTGDRVNRGRLDPKDCFGWQANASTDRLTQPLVRRGDRLEPATWDEAVERIVEASQASIARQGGGDHLGFYTSGQLFLEEYYTLAVIGKAGLGTPHMDGNTRLCTATAASSLKASFGTDGQPASYADVDHCDAIALWGHNVAETQAVLWMRMLDRRRGGSPPAMLAVDPRSTAVTREADVHLAPRNGTNLALLLAITHVLLQRGWWSPDWVEAHTLGFAQLRTIADGWPPARAARVCDVPAADIEAAAELVGTHDRLLSTVLQGVYQSNQATATACAINNLHLLRGMIGRPGAGVLQMNGQPTAQNTRETGADGDLPGMRNWANAAHVRQLAELWNVPAATIPHDGPPTHAMRIWELAEEGGLDLLWISATNPAVSLPELGRVRRILRRPELLVVAQDLFLTETAALADIVLPAATWGEKTGAFTNADRTVHLSERAVDPPGEARADLDIFLDYATRMDLRDQDGAALIPWTDAEGAFDAWRACSRGRPCDYSGLSHAVLRERGPIQWPCSAEAPDGTERLYTDARFHTDPDDAETFGQSLETGEPHDEETYRAKRPEGRAFLQSTDFRPSSEVTDDDYPLLLTTGRTLYQFHTRSKTARAPELQAAAPSVWVELHPGDAGPLGLGEGDEAEISSRRGAIRAPVRLSGIRRGVAFVPFHFGAIPETDPDAAEPTAANELTRTAWDPVSKQPTFKVAAVRVRRVAGGCGHAPAPDLGGSRSIR